MKFPDGSTFDGNWVEDEIDGEGTYTYPNGDIYKGSFKQGKVGARASRPP